MTELSALVWSPLAVLLVAAGGAAGALARWALASAIDRPPDGLPLGTLIVNLSGACGLGVLAGIASTSPLSVYWWWLLAIGVFGSFTTVSSLALQLARYWQAGRWRRGIGYLTLSLVAGLGLAAAGYFLGSGLRV